LSEDDEFLSFKEDVLSLTNNMVIDETATQITTTECEDKNVTYLYLEIINRKCNVKTISNSKRKI
jgi:hypothetical protein